MLSFYYVNSMSERTNLLYKYLFLPYSQVQGKKPATGIFWIHKYRENSWLQCQSPYLFGSLFQFVLFFFAIRWEQSTHGHGLKKKKLNKYTQPNGKDGFTQINGLGEIVKVLYSDTIQSICQTHDSLNNHHFFCG